MSTSRQKMRKKKARKKWVVATLSIAILLFSALIVFAINLTMEAKKTANTIYEPLERETEVTTLDAVKEEDRNFSVLLVGVDTQGGAKYGLSDVLIVVTVNPKKEDITMVSIPRDSLVYIPDLNKKDKINHSFSNGGINYTVNTVENLLDIPIDYYVTTDFQGFEDIVDTVGGIEVNVPFTFKAQLTGSLKWKTFTEGPMELNGNEALAYVRMRKSDPQGDFGRNQRQKEVIKQIIDKGTSLKNISKLDEMLEDVSENIRTNIPSSNYLGLIKLYQNMKTVPITQLTIEGEDLNSGGYYFIPSSQSLDQVSEELKRSLDPKDYKADKSSSFDKNLSSGE